MPAPRVVVCSALLAILVWTAPLLADDRVDNPEYASWSRFKTGTSISVRSVNSSAGSTSEVITTTMLLELAADKATLVSTALLKDKAMDFKSPPEKRQEPKIISLPTGIPKGLTRDDYLASKPPGATEEGTEVIKLNGRELKTRWYKYSVEIEGNKLQGKRWISSEVPGNVVKSEVMISGPGGFSSNLKLELVELKLP